MEKHGVVIQTLDTGNVVFSYHPISYKSTFSKRVLIPLLVFILTIGVAVILFQKLYLQWHLLLSIILIISFIVVCLNVITKWLVYTEKLNDKIEREIIANSLKNVIAKDIASFGKNIVEIERKIEKTVEGEYDIVKEKFLTLVLSNGVEIRYYISFISHYEKFLVQEIDTQHKKNPTTPRK